MRAVRKVDVTYRDYHSEASRYSVQVARGGEPVPGIQPQRITDIQEEVMLWRDADHIHGWFVDNVQNGKDDGQEHFVHETQLRKLLAVCEQVLNNSHLVRKNVFKEADDYEINRRMDAKGEPPRGIKNVSVAYKLLPHRKGSWWASSQGEYGEAYLKDVEATRDWAECMLMDSKRGAPGKIFYSGG